MKPLYRKEAPRQCDGTVEYLRGARRCLRWATYFHKGRHLCGSHASREALAEAVRRDS